MNNNICPICEKKLKTFIYNFKNNITETIKQCNNCQFTLRIFSDKLEFVVKDHRINISYFEEIFNKKKEHQKLKRINKIVNFYRQKLNKEKIKYFPRLKKICSRCKKLKSIKNFYNKKSNIDGHHSYCKICAKEKLQEYSLTFNGWLRNAYHTMKQRQKRKFNKELNFTKEQLFKWINKNEWQILWNDYIESKYDQRYQVCISRKNYKQDYNLNNLKLQNYRNVCLEALELKPMKIRKINTRKCIGQYKNGILIKIWNSIRETERILNCDGSAISKVCRGKYKNHHGFEWKYI